MHRFILFLVNALAVLSLLLWLATIRLWAGAGSGSHWLENAASDRALVVYDGVIEFGTLSEPRPFIKGKNEGRNLKMATSSGAADDLDARSVQFQIGGIQAVRGQLVPPSGWRDVLFGDGLVFKSPLVGIAYQEYFVPVAYPAILFALLPLYWFFHRIYRRRVVARQSSQNLCPTCSYSLTGNGSGVCPECGTVANRATV